MSHRQLIYHSQIRIEERLKCQMVRRFGVETSIVAQIKLNLEHMFLV